ncbi:MAG: amidohydrolase family protein, partial [Pseudomonadota bacterium]|nr:amidohydrolase family protein [Pseudomonadota bacterium]
MAIVGGTIIDGNGGDPIEDGVILINCDRLVAVGGRSIDIPPQASLVDASRKFIIPGLMDANVHLVADYWPLSIIRYEGRYDELAIEAAQICLKGGVTTVFDTWGPRAYLVKAREAIKAGKVVASRIFLGGNIVGLGGPFSNDFLPNEAMLEEFPETINSIWQENVGPELVWKSPDQVRAEIREYTRRDIDFLKFAVTTHRGEQQHLMFSPRVQRVIVEEAHRAGLTVQTHTTTNEAMYQAIQAEVNLMQHMDLTFGPEPIPKEIIALAAERRIPGGLLPQTDRALSWYRENAGRTPMLRRYEVMEKNARGLIAAGAEIVLTTDAGIFSRNTLNSSSWKSWQL